MNSLEFFVRIETQLNDDSVAFPVALCTLLVDGSEPIASCLDKPLDALLLIANLDAPGELHPYTCSCGVAECAGLEPWRLRALGEIVELSMPAHKTFAAQVFQFSRDDYLLKLALLEEQLTAYEKAYPDLEHAPVAGSPQAPRKPLEEVLATWRTHILERNTRDRAMRVGLGDMEQMTVRVECQAGVFELSPTGLSNLLFPSVGYLYGTGELLAHWKRVREVMLGDLHSVLSAASWEDFRQSALAVRPSMPGAPYPELAQDIPTDFWTQQAVVRLVKNNEEMVTLDNA